MPIVLLGIKINEQSGTTVLSTTIIHPNAGTLLPFGMSPGVLYGCHTKVPLTLPYICTLHIMCYLRSTALFLLLLAAFYG